MNIFVLFYFVQSLITITNCTCCPRKSLLSCWGEGSCNILCCNCNGGCDKKYLKFDFLVNVLKDLLFRSSAANSKKIEKCSKIFFIICSFSKTFFHDKNENDFSKAKRNSNSKLGNGKLGRYDDSRILQLFSGSNVGLPP